MLMAALPSSVAQARMYTRWVLDAWQMSELADTVELLVSELVTNAVKATGPKKKPAHERFVFDTVNPVYLGLSVSADTLLIEVRDASVTPPLRRVAAENDETGRGLMLVQTLSKEWGCEVLEGGGKIVWCKCLIGEEF
ncbi:ATP-binding protein [Actinomadura sp. DC4]|uniref:ATP-binding protein n=1 Tax=Actinomadura sp. DC4 TaxID=3055069 RepID=UPI0025AF0E6E|nr:ATP-binding protein [Actinomadura sp. DC4]MDN3355843.1 ATP-binding protein [Actinomadura sp. DC4]